MSDVARSMALPVPLWAVLTISAVVWALTRPRALRPPNAGRRRPRRRQTNDAASARRRHRGVLHPPASTAADGTTATADAMGEPHTRAIGRNDVTSPAGGEPEPGKPDVEVPDDAHLTLIRLLGPPAIQGPARQIACGAAKTVWDLLGLLVMYRTGLARETAYQVLWPDADPGVDRELFWRPMRTLRSLLCDAQDLPATSGKHVIQHVGNHVYRLNPALFITDVWQLLDALDLAARTTDQPTRADALRHAVALAGGQFLPASICLWAEELRAQLSRRVLRAWRQLADLETDSAAKVAALDEAAAIDPLDECLARQRMQLHDTLGNMAAIHRIYQNLADGLHDLDPLLKPSTETTSLVRSLVFSSTDLQKMS